jgi:D-beta-D-heptose 7-phosphate kinase/D-beta-D-heptose 1-phosphate adenosyltransferase
MFDFEALSDAIASQTVLCVGDLMLDEFVYGEVSRISPEAPAPVMAVRRSETNIGGAGNVARNIAALGARCIFVGLVGEDDAGAALKSALAQEARIESVLVSDPSRPTTRKVRFVSEHFSLLVLRVRKAVGIHHQNVSFVELERAGLISGEIKHPQEISVRG